MKRTTIWTFMILTILAALNGGSALAQVVQPPLELYRLQPTARWSPGMCSGYSDGDWVPVRAVLNQQHLEAARDAAAAQGLGGGAYLVGLVRTTFNSLLQGGTTREGNSMQHFALQGLYAPGQMVMIEDGTTMMINNGEADANSATSTTGGNEPFAPTPFVFGAYPASGWPTIPLTPLASFFRRGQPVFPGSAGEGGVGQIVGVGFSSSQTPAQLQAVVLQLAVRLAPSGLLPVDGNLTGVNRPVPGCSGFPGPGNNFIGFFVSRQTGIFQPSGPVPTGVAVVPARCDPPVISPCQINGLIDVFGGQTAYYSATTNLSGTSFTWSIASTTGGASASLGTPAPDGMAPVTFVASSEGTVTLQLTIVQGSSTQTCTLVINVHIRD